MIQYKTQPMEHQRTVLERCWEREFFAWYWEMGLGKSKIAVDNAVALFNAGKIQGLLIFSDKGAYLNWTGEFEKHCSVPFSIHIWNANKRFRAPGLRSDKLVVILCNIEGMSTERLPYTLKPWLYRARQEKHRLMCIVDEATSIKSHNAKRSKTMAEWVPLLAYRRILTGTPMVQNPLDLFGQWRFLAPDIFPKSYWVFRNEYAILDTEYFGQKSFQIVVGFKNREKLAAQIDPHCSRLTKKQCLDLPEKIYTTRRFEMTREQKAAYETLKADLMLQMGDGSMVTATLAIQMIMRLRQLARGRVVLPSGHTERFRCTAIDSLKRLLDDHEGKTLIWCAFQDDVVQITEELGNEAVAYYGELNDVMREMALDRFKNDPACKYFVATPRTGGKGLTLIEATQVIYYSQDYNLESRLQSEDRAHRIGQTEPVTYVDLICEGTVDEAIVENLTTKRDNAEAVLGLLKQALKA